MKEPFTKANTYPFKKSATCPVKVKEPYAIVILTAETKTNVPLDVKVCIVFPPDVVIVHPVVEAEKAEPVGYEITTTPF